MVIDWKNVVCKLESVGRGAYRHSCPNCGGPNTEWRLARGLPCARCLPEPVEGGIIGIAKALRRLGRLRERYRELERLERESLELIGFFEKAVGSPPWGAQRTWARRLVRGDSFSIIAPTGVGKTTFGLVASLFLASRGERSLIVLPTTTLVIQAYRRARSMAGSAGLDPGLVVAVHSKMRVGERREALDRLLSGDFGVAIVTAAFARKHAETLASHRYRLVFVDDVDAVLRSSKSVDAVLRLVGFRGEDIEVGLEMLRLQRRQAAILAQIMRLQAEARRRQAGERLERLRSELAEVEEKLERLQARVERARRRAASLIVSSATGRPRGARVRLFRVLLGFEAGGRSDIGLRRVVDSYTYPADGVYDRVVELVSMLRDGVLVYVPIDHGIEGAERLAGMLREAGVEAEAYHAKKPASILDDFAEGRLQALVGVANYYGVLVRGLDLPARVRYAVFAGVPRHKFTAEIGEPHPSRLLRLLGLLVDAPIREVAEEARRHLAELRRVVRNLSPAALQVIAERVLEGDVEGRGTAVRIVWEAYNFLRNALADEEVWRYLSERSDVAVVVEDGKRYLLIADAATYVQASGRTSRLYAGGITLGLSIVVVDDERLFRGLARRTQWMVDARWTRLEELDLEKLMAEIEEERRRVRELLGGKVRVPDLVRTALLVVESPNKARTIARFFGQPSIRILPGGLRAYEVATGDYILTIAASGGHVYDLVVDATPEDLPGVPEEAIEGEVFGVALLNNGRRDYIPVYTSIKRCLDCGYQFTEERDTCPICGSRRIRDSRIVVEDLRRLSWEVDVVLIGTDPDTEGEKIGWDVSLLLRPYSRSMKRLEFHEVTRRAIQEALRQMREFDDRLVDAQIVRRVEDRWIGFSLSPLLWCHFWPNYYCSGRAKVRGRDRRLCEENKYYYNLSAGRVQTPTLGWVIERTRQNADKVAYFSLEIPLDGERSVIRFKSDELGEPSEVEKLIAQGVFGYKSLPKTKTLEAETPVVIEVIEEAEEKLAPLPPYTTDTMIADANRYLRLGAPETMRLAQNLFEWGLITYHRTDSTRVSDKGIDVAREWIQQAFPEHAERLFRPRRWGEGGAHEAIRPTRPIDAETLARLVEEGIIEVAGAMTRNHYRLYDLIFRRFMASQMAEAPAKRARYRVTILVEEARDGRVERRPAGSLEVERIIQIGVPGDPASKGFTLVWPYAREEPPLPVGEVYAVFRYLGMRGRVPLYTQGDIIRLMKERGIGRPSTYAKIVETLLKRAYIVRVSPNGGEWVKSTPRGEAVYEYLTSYLAEAPVEELPRVFDPNTLRRVPALVSEERTRQLQELMDAIERGEASRVNILDQVYGEIEGIALPIARAFRENLDSLSECVRGYRRRGEAGEGG